MGVLPFDTDHPPGGCWYAACTVQATVSDPEALLRLVAGRLDPAHTPAGADTSALAVLRQDFPGL